jgi:YVTN family beta-propeller protein
MKAPAVALALAAAALSAYGLRVKDGHAPRVYVSNEDSRDISVIDTGTDEVIATVFVGQRPRGLRLSRDGRRLYVALSGSPKSPPGADESRLPAADRSADGLAVVDLATLRLVRTLPGGRDPESFDLSLDGRTAYVSNEETAEASVVDVETGAIRSVVSVGGEPEGVTVRPDGREVFVTSEEDHRIDVIATSGNTVVATLPTGDRPRSIVFTADSQLAFVTNELSGTVQVFDVPKRARVAEVALAGDDAATKARPMGAALSPDDKTLYVTTGRGGTVSVVDVARKTLVGTWRGVGARPWGIGVTPDGRKVYTANGPSNDVTVLDAASGRILKRIPAGASPWGVAMAQR